MDGMKAHTTEGESEAMQVGRDDYKALGNLAKIGDGGSRQYATCPFPQGSEYAEQWKLGWQAEADGK